MKVAVHNDDIDGISCAALLILAFENPEIDFLSVTEAQETDVHYKVVADLPKTENCDINIDHHETNLENLRKTGRLSKMDLIDPSAPSAAKLVAKYFKLDSQIAKEIVEMANKADVGELDDDLYKLDKVIKFYVNDDKTLARIAKILAKKGRSFINDREFNALWLKVSREMKRSLTLINNAFKKLETSKSKYAVIILKDNIPYFLAKDLAHKFINGKGLAAAVIYKDPNTGMDRLSIRVSKKCDVKANKIAEKLGGGGHEKAAGAILRDKNYAILKILEEFAKRDMVSILTVG